MQDMTPWRWGGLRRWRRDDEPFGDIRTQMESLHKEMDRLFESMITPSWGEPLMTRAMLGESVTPVIDEREDDKAYHVSVELPGMEKKDVEITLADRRLTIQGEKKQDKKEEGKDFYRRERNFGAFRRTLILPMEVDESAIEASFKNGVLNIELPKTKEAQAKIKHIDVKAA